MRNGVVHVMTLALIVLGSVALAGDGWLTDFEKAKKEAAEKKLPILAEFSGSDWCPPCQMLHERVLAKPEFKKFAKKNLILFQADFPRQSKLPKETMKQNEKLAMEYGVDGFPTVILFDSKGKVLTKETGYQGEGPDEYVKHLKDLLKKAKSKGE